VIQVYFTHCKFGVQMGEQGHIQLNIMHEPSSQVFHIPFNEESAVGVVKLFAGHMNEKQKAEVMSALSGGIVLPGQDNFRPPEMGPQG
jgi:hypothetical protein